MHRLDFENLILYDAGRVGISLDVKIQLGNLTANLEAKIDTGAEGCIFERKYGEQIGIEIESGELQNFSTTTNSFNTYGHSVTLITKGFRFDSYVFFAADESFQKNILGRYGWLNRLIVGINDYDGKLYLSRYESE
ncbi:MAG: hypothetical protein KIS76_07915 [Pyrinomonadaceae bacterium]|nr:hypothetical protein [Pyrinomonadaceae bacterium]